jgi:hypothetical protein
VHTSDSAKGYEPRRWRAMAADAWSSAAAFHGGGRAGSAMPAYFADRVGYRLYRSPDTPAHQLLADIPPFAHEAADFPALLTSSLRSHPSVGNAFPPRALDEPFVPSGLLAQLLRAWRRFLFSRGIDVGTSFSADHETTLLQLYATSVYFPGPVAIDGPGFLEWLDPSQVASLIDAYGPTGVAEFAVALEVIHEESHFYQTGDPLLAEIALAHLWCDFVVEEGLLTFQKNVATGRWCNLEQPFLAGMGLDPEQVIRLFLDTADGVASVLGPDPRFYELLCSMTNRLDFGVLSYHDYLTQVMQLFSSRSDLDDIPFDSLPPSPAR